jgi:hypothetical protein
MQDHEPQGSKPPEATSDGVITHVPICWADVDGGGVCLL